MYIYNVPSKPCSGKINRETGHACIRTGLGSPGTLSKWHMAKDWRLTFFAVWRSVPPRFGRGDWPVSLVLERAGRWARGWAGGWEGGRVGRAEWWAEGRKGGRAEGRKGGRAEGRESGTGRRSHVAKPRTFYFSARGGAQHCAAGYCVVTTGQG